jgi:hypothetical protein
MAYTRSIVANFVDVGPDLCRLAGIACRPHLVTVLDEGLRQRRPHLLDVGAQHQACRERSDRIGLCYGLKIRSDTSQVPSSVWRCR